MAAAGLPVLTGASKMSKTTGAAVGWTTRPMVLCETTFKVVAALGIDEVANGCALGFPSVSNEVVTLYCLRRMD